VKKNAKNAYLKVVDHGSVEKWEFPHFYNYLAKIVEK
jgi:hypothetical protein